MIMEVFCVADKAVQAYLPPFFARARGEAIRSFSEACNDEKHQFFRHSSDYELCSLGTFDDGTGVFDCHGPETVVSAIDVIVPANPFTPEKEIPAVASQNGGFILRR